MTDSKEKFSITGQSALWIFAVFSLFLFLGHNALWGSEDRWAEITREMIATGDYLHPAMNWRIYFDKPQMSYWFILPWAFLLGMSELTARIPSAVAALVGLYGTVMLARQFFDRRTALLSGWILASCYGFLFWGRTAAADMANMSAAVLAAAWFFYARKSPCFWKYMVFYLIVFVGALTKGLPALLVPAAFLFPFLIRTKEIPKHIKASNIFAFIIGLALYILPFYIAAEVRPAPGLLLPDGPVLSGLELVWRENIVRAFNAFDHRDPFYSYFYHLPRILLPWAVFFVPAVIVSIVKWKTLSTEQKDFLLGIGMVFLMFSCSTSRRWYYILPLAPFCCIYLATVIFQYIDNEVVQKIIRWSRAAAMTAAALAFVSPISLVLFSMKGIEPPMIAVLAVSGGGALVLLVMLLDNAPGSRIERFSGLPHLLASLVFSFAVITAVVFSAVQPSLTIYRTEKPFILDMKEKFAGTKPAQILFYETDSAAKFQFYMQWDGPTAVEWKNTGGVKKFFDRNAGREVLIICYFRKRELEPLFAELQAEGIDTRDLKPAWKESGRGKQWSVFKLQVPEKGQ